MARPRENLLRRFMEKVIHNGGEGECWTWEGARNNRGYGVVWRDGATALAHRVAYELFVGPIPAGLHIDHVQARGCHGGTCVNPAHLEPVTNRENTLRGQRAVIA